MSLADLLPDCPVCGALIVNVDLHQRFHDSLREISRLVIAPDMSPEEWNAAIVAEAAKEAGK